MSTLTTTYFTPKVTQALKQLSCSAGIRKGSSFAAGVDIPTKRVSVFEEDLEDPSYVIVLVELHAIRGLAALRDAENGHAIVASPLVLLRSGMGIMCRASCLGQTLLTSRSGDTIIVVYVRLLASELERFRAAPFSLQVIMVLEGCGGSSCAENTTTQRDAILLGSEKVPLQDVEHDEHGWKGMSLRSFAELQVERDTFSWVMLSSQQCLPRWKGVTRYNPKERLCAGVIDCDFVACPAVYVSDARLSANSIWSFRLLSCASAFSQQLGDQADKSRDQRSREEVVEDLGREKYTVSTVPRWPPESQRAQFKRHIDELKDALKRPCDVELVVGAIAQIALRGASWMS